MLGDHDVGATLPVRNLRGAWFKDPDGNILALVNQPSGPQ